MVGPWTLLLLMMRLIDHLQPSTLASKCPGASAIELDFLESCLAFDPAQRLTAEHAMRHPFFDGIDPDHDRMKGVSLEWGIHSNSHARITWFNKFMACAITIGSVHARARTCAAVFVYALHSTRCIDIVCVCVCSVCACAVCVFCVCVPCVYRVCACGALQMMMISWFVLQHRWGRNGPM
jgi:hypothetical protein